MDGMRAIIDGTPQSNDFFTIETVRVCFAGGRGVLAC
jgi:hypothetical protein